jgi:hypothetical protein
MGGNTAKPIEKQVGAQPGNANSRKHGIYALELRGENSLAPAQRSRLQELKEQFNSEPGRVEYRQELAAFLAMMLELGFSSIREIAEKGGSIWESPPVARMGVYLNALIRLLDGWPKEGGGPNILDVLRGRDET